MNKGLSNGGGSQENNNFKFLNLKDTYENNFGIQQIDITEDVFKITQALRGDTQGFLGKIFKEFQPVAYKFNQSGDKFKIKDREYNVNGENVKSLDCYLKKIDWKKLSEGIAVNFHGDLQFDNIIFNQANNIFKLIDWRADFNNQLVCGDLYYDLAKLYGGCILPYNQIKNNNFLFNFDKNKVFFDFGLNNSNNDANKIILDFFVRKKFDVKKIEIITSLIYINMSPLHSEPFSHLLYFFGISRLKKLL